ncbi:MAG: TonB-dependent receptor [Flavobacteriales bacterium]|nr:TonB-dependent receptor [Flavobacteriales bacterium]
MVWRAVTACFLGFIFWGKAEAQVKAELYGRVTDDKGAPVEAVSIGVPGVAGVATDANGSFSLLLPPGTYELVVSHLNYERLTLAVTLQNGQRKKMNLRILPRSNEITIIDIESERFEGSTIRALDPENARLVSTPGDPLIGLLKSSGMGVASNNELSTGYSVRGGNFDENLIYINDIEVYRPFLARAGQQEGLSFINSDMVSAISFSTGGFPARYGEKMSSVLDIEYLKPTRFRASVSGGITGGSLLLQDAWWHKRLRMNLGARYRANNYILRGLDTRGDYQPRFGDFQGQLTFDITENLDITALGIYSLNQFITVPRTRETAFGLINQAYRFTVYFEGREKTQFRTGLGALTLNWRPRREHQIKFIGSYTDTRESETFDVLGQYRLSDLEINLGSEEFGQETQARGVGGFLNHARNYLDARVMTGQVRGMHSLPAGTLRWGADWRTEHIRDRMREWNMQDSLGFLIPYFGPRDTQNLRAPYVLKSAQELNSHRFMLFVEHTFNWRTRDSLTILLNVGARAQYWTYNQEWMPAPRLYFSLRPKWRRPTVFRLAAGVYYQAPFYREFRDPWGRLNPHIRAQRSLHFIAGVDYIFRMWDRPFKFVTEVYYKAMDRLIPYQLDNVRIRYYATNNARGFATGVDMKLHGQFVKGVESWFTLSVMSTKEDLKDDVYFKRLDAQGQPVPPASNVPVADSVAVYPGYLPRPVDQRVSLSIFFQDYIRNNPNYKVHLNLLFGTGWPFGPPTFRRYQDVFRMPFYRRVDIGFSFQLLQAGRNKEKEKRLTRIIKAAWLSLEVFNLLGIRNTVSYTWIRDNYGLYYPVPNYLTPRLFNARFVLDF